MLIFRVLLCVFCHRFLFVFISPVSGVADAVAGLPAAMQLPGMAAFMAQRQGAQALTGGAGGVAALQLKAAMARCV